MRVKQEDWSSDQWAEYYEKLSQKNYMDYQDSGDPRYDRAWHRYERISDAFRAKAREENERGDEMRKRLTNKDGAVARLIPDKSYSYSEVVSLLEAAVWW